MKKTKIFLLTFVFAFVAFGTLVPLDSCACITPESFIKGSASSVNRVIQENYEQNGVYPSFETLLAASTTDIIRPLAQWTEDPVDQRVYYTPVDEGQGYLLAGYAESETLFGRSVLKRVYFVSK